MTADEIVKQLKPLGQDAYKKVLLNHGIKEPLFGVKIEELKKFQKKIKRETIGSRSICTIPAFTTPCIWPG